MSISWQLVESPRPALLLLPPGVASLDEAHAAIELWEFYKRRKLDPWQRLSVELKMATRADGRWAARTTGEEVPRQAGKGDAEEVVELWGLVQRSERILHTIHDAVLLATETQSRMLSLFEGHPDLRRLKKREWTGTGQQMIEMRNGGIIWYRTRTGGGGRGVDEVDRIVVDEAQHAEAAQIEATSPTQLASENPQTNAMGTGALEGKSAWWWKMRRRALLPNPGEYAYLGFTAEKLSVVNGKVVADRPDVSTIEQFMELVHVVHPVISRRPDLADFFVEEYHKLGPEGAAREYLLVWDQEPGEFGGVMPNWSNVGDPDSKLVANHQWAIATSSDRKWTTIGVAGRRADGSAHVATHRRQSGTAWVVPAAVEFYETHRIPVRIWKSGPEASFIPLLVERGVEVVEVSTAEVARATGQLRDGVDTGTVRHPTYPDEPDRLSSLDRAVAGAELRESTDGAAVWSQRNSQVEISPLVAVTVALGGVPEELAKSGDLFMAVT